jgi:hypothetical protein
VWFLFSKVKGSLTARREEGGEREKKKGRALSNEVQGMFRITTNYHCDTDI